MNQLTMANAAKLPPSCGKGKVCSMNGCKSAQFRCPDISFFRFPRELSRAKEWLLICDRPDLLNRVDSDNIIITNRYVCELHFPNQILDYLHKKVLVKAAKPLSMIELQKMLEKDAGHREQLVAQRHSEFQDEKGIGHNNLKLIQKNDIVKRNLDVKIPERVNLEAREQDGLPVKRKRCEAKKNSMVIVDKSNEAKQSSNHRGALDESWWKNYFERKLEMERERIEKEDEHHKDRMNFQKMAIMSQERIEKTKIEAMNNLTNALLCLQKKSN